MQKANQAVLLGFPIDRFDQLAGAAIKLGRAMGIDASQAVESLTLGVGRQSKLILDNLGIIVSAEEATRLGEATAEELARADVYRWQELRAELDYREAVRNQQRRFRRDPANYLKRLENLARQSGLPA